MEPISTDTTTTLPGLTAGSWHVDPKSGHVAFRVRSMWGLADVKGSFSRYQGSLTVAGTGATGEFVVDTASLDTRNRKRDAHLRSPDFFDSQVHPQARFVMLKVNPGANGQIVFAGDLVVGTSRTSLALPAIIEPAGHGAVTVRASTSIPRETVGLTWNWMGAIKGDARLDIELRLTNRG